MDHPNIAKVFDGGATTSGRPYFVMELVKGLPITEFCDQNQMATRQRLELFIRICQAVQHAHQKGIIHRDLKPSNVLVTMHDTMPVVKVIDFGVAKALGQELTEKTLFTGFAQMIGTPLYMSPEQAGQSGLDIDTRSDIYSLGVLLYELLTGTTPFDKERFKLAAFEEIRRIIREEEPPRPSTRLSDSTDSLPSISAQRQTEPAKLTKLVRGELDWIVMKALEKDRARRYETANTLADDVQRYLADEAVQACPPSAGYRLRKFVRRNKARLAVGALTLFFIVLLCAGIGWVVRDHAAQRAETASGIDSALQEAVRHRNQKNWREARAAARRADLLLAGHESPHLRGRLRDLLTDLDLVDRLERICEDQLLEQDDFWDPSSADVAYEAAFRQFGIDVMSLDAAVAAQRVRASAISEELLAALDDWGWVSRKQPRRADLVRAVVCLVDPDPWRVRFRDPVVQRNRIALEELASQPDVAKQPPSAVACLGRALRDAGSPVKAVEVMAAAQRRHPDHFWLNMYLGSVLRWRIHPPRYEEAAGYLRAALAVRPNAPRIQMELGGCLRRPGHEDEAIAAFRRALELQPAYAHPHHSIGQALAMKGDWPEAIESFQKCLAGKINAQLAASVRRDLCAAYRAVNDWDKAASVGADWFELNADDLEICFEYAGILLLTGRTETYERLCARLLERGDNLKCWNSPGRKSYLLARIILLAPTATADPDRAVRLAEESVKADPSVHHLHTLGLAQYRAHLHKAAIKGLGDSLNADPRWPAHPTSWIVLALAHHGEDHSDEARKWFDKSVNSIARDREARPKAATALGMNMHDWLAWLLLRREAEELLKAASP